MTHCIYIAYPSKNALLFLVNMLAVWHIQPTAFLSFGNDPPSSYVIQRGNENKWGKPGISGIGKAYFRSARDYHVLLGNNGPLSGPHVMVSDGMHSPHLRITVRTGQAG